MSSNKYDGRDHKGVRIGGPSGLVRRDFLNGTALAVGASLLGANRAFGEIADPLAQAYYPPALTGMRGSHAGSYEVAHGAASGQTWAHGPVEEEYDLVVVGAGISGLAAAYFYRRDVDDTARILILDNHDDFGGHARRNEFTLNGETFIGFGGTMLIESPRGYPQVARDLIRELGVTFDTDAAFNHQAMIDELGLGAAHFLDGETFGEDGLVVGDLARAGALDSTSLSDRGRSDVQRLFADETTYLDEFSTADRKRILETLSWREYLRIYARMGDEALAMIQKRPHGVWAIGADALPAWLAWDSGYPGFGDLDLGNDLIEGAGAGGDSDRVRFPDGNATVARLLVSRLVPSSTKARSVDEIVSARFDYEALDRAASAARIRLRSTVVRVAHGDEKATGPVQVTYVRGGKAHAVAGKKVIWAGYHAMLPHVCPDLPEEQSSALSQSVRAPLVYTNVLLRNWRSLAALGTYRVNCPGSFYQHVRITHPVSYGPYRYARSPDDPVILHLQHIPLAPGRPAPEQFREGRRQLLETSFDEFEGRLRDQLTRMFSAGGFDADRDIRGITVNRWSHGYAYTCDAESGDVAWYPERWRQAQPWVNARRAFGNIAIAGTDAASNAMTEAAIEEAHRAVHALGSESSDGV